MHQFKKLGPSGNLLIFLMVIYAVTSQNPLITLAAVLIPFFFYVLLWKEEESPFLFLAMMLQWLSVTVKVFYSNYEGLDFENVFDNYRHIKEAFYLSLLGLLTVTLGIHLVIRKFELPDQNFKKLALDYSYKKIVPIYIGISLGAGVLYRIAFINQGLQQPITKLADFKWMAFFIMMLCLLYNRQWKIFTMIALFEIVLSLTGFFSNFKDYFLVIFGGIILIFGRNLKFKQLIPLVIVGTSCVYMLIIWQYVKPNYRKYLNGGEASQTVKRSREESLNKLAELVGNVNEKSIDEGFKMTVDRISYIDYFSATIDYVPRVVPHTNGGQWSDAIMRVLQPRLFFPGKAFIDDSQTTAKYTGIEVAGAERGASISLGYATENYIDFGMFGMMFGLFGYGLIIGFIYRYIMMSSPDKLVGTAMIIPLFFIIYTFESALNKIIGASFMYLIIYELFRRFALKRFLRFIR